jgi:uncharacterized protein (DUF3820 family)
MIVPNCAMMKKGYCKAHALDDRQKRGHPVLGSEQPNEQVLIKLANQTMPFGKYQGRLLIDLPEPYVCWFERKGFPKGELGELLQTLYVIKLKGLEGLVRPLKRS